MVRDAVRRLRLAFTLVDADLRKEKKVRARAWSEIGKFLVAVTKEGPGAETGGIWVGSRLSLPEDAETRDEQLFDLQSAVDRILTATAWRAVLPATPDPLLGLPPVRLVLGPVPSNDRVVITVVEGSVTDRYVLALMLLLAHVGAERVRRCPACKGAFLKLGRRTHCGRADCRRQRASDYWKRYTKTPAGRRARRRLYQHLYDTVYAEHGWKPGGRSKRTAKRRSG